jgi:outer membrane receptor for ferrienterochelin and colicin
MCVLYAWLCIVSLSPSRGEGTTLSEVGVNAHIPRPARFVIGVRASARHIVASFDITGCLGNLYAGDTQNTNNDNKTNGLVKKYYGKETNRMYRQNYALTWNGGWDNGITTSNWAQYEHTRNSRLGEGLAGGLEGLFNSNQFTDTDLADVTLHSEINIPFDLLVNQNLTLGTEWNQQRMKDMSSNTQTFMGGNIPGASSTDRSPYSQAEIFSLFAENNMELTDSTMLTPGLRFDHHSVVGDNWSPSLNLSQGLGDDFTLKMGIARAILLAIVPKNRRWSPQVLRGSDMKTLQSAATPPPSCATFSVPNFESLLRLIS